MRGQAGFWDIDERYVRLSEAGDPLEKLNALVPWEVFRKPVVKTLKRSDGTKGGRPPYDPLLMFKIMVLQALYGLSDDQAEFQIQDRLSFMRFLGLGLGDRVPDAKTIWLFREYLTQAGAVENLFARFDKHLTNAGYLAMGGQIVDATIVAAPNQRNIDAEKADIKGGKVPDKWKEKPAKLRQKDRDALRECSHDPRSKILGGRDDPEPQAAPPYALDLVGAGEGFISAEALESWIEGNPYPGAIVCS